jgi:hypothetical protein
MSSQSRYAIGGRVDRTEAAMDSRRRMARQLKEPLRRILFRETLSGRRSCSRGTWTLMSFRSLSRSCSTRGVAAMV